jgi:hypothetical protein
MLNNFFSKIVPLCDVEKCGKATQGTEDRRTAHIRYGLYTEPPRVGSGDSKKKLTPPPTRVVRLQIFKLNREDRLSLAE